MDIASRRPIIYTVDYLDGYQYESGKLLFFPTAEGYVKYTVGVSNPFDYVFNYTDHLGNIRLSYGINPATGLLKKMEENNYYPFGLKHGSYNIEEIIIAPRPVGGPIAGKMGKFMMQKEEPFAGILELPTQEPTIVPNFYSGYNFKFGNKELQDELGMNIYDFGARNYDPALGRWLSVDPLAEKFISESPFAYVNNDPMGYSDFDGKDYTIDITRDKDGNITGISISGTVYIQGTGASEKRANELNKFAKDNLKSKTIDGVSISIGVNYKYDNEKKEKDLKQGENLLTFDSTAENDDNISHINSMEISQEGKKTKFLTGKTGTIYDNGQDNNTVFHESMHLLGLVDRYEDNRDKKWIPKELRGTIPDKGYEKNVMGNSSSTNLNQQQFRSWMEHAVSRSKSNNNTNRIIGVLQVDKSIKTGR